MFNFFKGLKKTRNTFTKGVTRLFLGKKTIDDSLFEELETCLLTADVGVEVTQRVMKTLTDQVKRKHLADPQVLFNALKTELIDILTPSDQPFTLPDTPHPFIMLMVGINGAGKTTTIGKLAHQFQHQGKNIMLAAGDTFRAAAIEQLQAWGERHNVPVIAQRTGADSASVAYDALSAAKARNVDLLIVDTAGRLHTQTHLMEELKKVTRVMKKIDDTAPHEVMLVLDASIGQNALQQAKQFHEAIGVTGITVTKLDGTAKGGILFAIANQMKLPIRYIGVGERSEDLQPFNAEAFVEDLLTIENAA